MHRLFVLIPAILVFFSLTTPVALAQDPTNGKKVWEEQIWQCAKCHGPQGEGLYARPLSNSTLAEDEWIAQVRTPRKFMPSFSEAQVSDQQIKDIRAYITSLPQPTGEFKRKDPGTAADPGENAMRQHLCIACHDDAIEQGTGIIEGFVKRGVTPTAEVVLKQLRTPFKNMPSFSAAQVPDAEAAPIADFLAAQVAKAAPPSNLPTSGGDIPITLPLALLLVGGGVVLVGFVVRRRMVKN